MRRIRSLTGPLVLGALLATTPQLAFGQPDEDSPVEITCRACRPSTEISSDELGEFLAKNLTISFSKEAAPGVGLGVNVKLRLELISRAEEINWKWESKAVEVEGGETYSGETWMSQRDRHEGTGLGDRLKVTITGSGTFISPITMRFPEICERATHAVRITLVSDDERGAPLGTIYLLCLDVEG